MRWDKGRRIQDFTIEEAWISVSSLSLTSWATLEILFNFELHLKNRKSKINLIWYVKWNEKLYRGTFWRVISMHLYQAIHHLPNLLETSHFYPFLTVQSELLSFVHTYIYCRYKGKSQITKTKFWSFIALSTYILSLHFPDYPDGTAEAQRIQLTD